MPNRVIKLALATYFDEDLQSRFALKGETVAVHSDHVKRFDELNVDMGPPHDPGRVPVEVVSPTQPAPPADKAPAKAEQKAPAKKET